MRLALTAGNGGSREPIWLLDTGLCLDRIERENGRCRPNTVSELEACGAAGDPTRMDNVVSGETRRQGIP